MSIRCSWFDIHEPELLGRWVAIEYGKHGLSKIRIKIPARCRRCGRLSLEEPQGEYSISFGWDDVITRDEALAVTAERAASLEVTDDRD